MPWGTCPTPNLVLMACRVYTVDLYSKEMLVVGYAMLNIFCCESTDGNGMRVCSGYHG